jgi:glycosyltransferase involved in cell wall biosynthesis
MKLIFVSAGQYPDGGAATNRHLAYAKGLKELGHEIEFILLNEQQWKEKDRNEQGIKLTCVYVQTFIKSPKIKRIKSLFKSIRKAKEKIVAEHTKSKITALILLDTSVLILIPLLKHGKKLQLKIFHERTEYPFVVAGKTILRKIDLYIYLKFVLKRFDGIFVINRVLKAYFVKKTKGKIPVQIINMIVDPSRFEFNRRSGGTETIITYCGTLDGDKDGVPILIESFAMIANEFPLLKLQLVGSINNKITRENIESLLKKFHIENRVIITGSAGRDEIPLLLCNSDILALARPAGKQAEGGFPTKLGEYLATGNTVVVTNVGEIGLFLKDNENAFVAEPGSVEKFSKKLREALLNNNTGQISKEGKKLVYNEFNYLTQAKLLEKMFLGIRLFS